MAEELSDPLDEETAKKVCKTPPDQWIVKENLAGVRAYFCDAEHYARYKKKSEATGICEFC